MKIADSGILERYWMNQSGISSAVSTLETQPAGNDASQSGNPTSTGQEIQPDRLELSHQAIDAYRNEKEKISPAQSKKPQDTSTDSKLTSQTDSKKKTSDASELNPEQQSEVRQLQSRDTSVRTHEMQHMAAAGPYAVGGPQYDMQSGPDGKQYAIGGHVNLDISPVPGNPQATISKAQVIQRAAMAPADPSGADRSVAASAAQMEAMARMELTQEQQSQSKNPQIIASRETYSPYASKTNSEMQTGKLVNMAV